MSDLSFLLHQTSRRPVYEIKEFSYAGWQRSTAIICWSSVALLSMITTRICVYAYSALATAPANISLGPSMLKDLLVNSTAQFLAFGVAFIFFVLSLLAAFYALRAAYFPTEAQDHPVPK